MKLRALLLASVIVAFTASIASAQLTPKEELGKNLFFDKIASPDNQSCAACHAPQVGFTGPIPGINKKGAVYPGAVRQRFGNRKPPTAAYATPAPIFYYDADEGLFIGGNFWDGRATGNNLGNPAADQALGPFLNPVEQNNPSKMAVLEQIAASQYAPLWEVVWGEPISYDTPNEIEENYDRIGLAIAAYEGSSEVNSFSSKWDYFMRGEATLSDKEMWGMELFNGKALCSACHPGPLFTDFTYDNLGVPKNPDNPFYRMDEVYLDDGTPINPLGDAWIDPGLGGFLETLPESFFDDLNLDKDETVLENWGKHKVPTLRNVAKGPSEEFGKAYMHNGVFTSLKQVVDFYNTRDVAKWPEPEVPINVNTDELGDLGLTKKEVNAIVAFMGTLSDGWVPEKTKDGEGVLKGATPTRIDLEVIGPNPFNPATQFSYSLPEAGPVRVAVYSMSGRLVATLLQGWKPSGQHDLVWAPGQLASGQYVVRLESGTTTVNRKVTLLK
ncbi:MAG: T9SS type A sorting domain-containing protein [Candidatus Latescibacterota bacterium]|nr:MAG: T9SS type A sorting domain-containing protein [Candidatus Latescibacterota bacterium]